MLERKIQSPGRMGGTWKDGGTSGSLAPGCQHIVIMEAEPVDNYDHDPVPFPSPANSVEIVRMY